MTLSKSRLSLILVCILALAAHLSARAAEPSDGTVSKHADVYWNGGPFVASNPAACVNELDPSCDHFYLTVDAKDGAHVAVAITTDDPAGNDFDLAVYAPDGTLLANSTTATGSESLVFEHREAYGAGPYEVRVQPWLVTPGTTYEGAAMVSRGAIDYATECLQPVPAAASLLVAPPVELNTMVLLDGVSRQRADEVMAQAATSYAPLGVSLKWKSRSVSYPTDDANALIQLAKDQFGGARPKGFDIVYVITNKDIQVDGDTSVAGLADCIGGVAWPTTAFAVGEDFGPEEDLGRELGPFVHTTNGSAIVAAHELGHLMGAHHHYGNCVQGLSAEDVENNELTPCTLMFNAVNFASLPFGTLNTTIVRGHAEEFALP